MPETTTDPKPRKKAGPPLKNSPDRVPYHEVDRPFVFGELARGPEGEPPFGGYPSLRAIARRYGVNHSVIAGYVKRRTCLERREQNQQHVTARVDDKLVERRATEVAVGKGDAAREAELRPVCERARPTTAKRYAPHARPALPFEFTNW